ncbi:hypothetical protein VTJ49DRAFT_5819 [Mycothermus thermophilus]|uniref:BZIP domain-containing protein n=1 Tax=Humicola insolens TaxID=85995 RepID=A0ABR3VKT2_HUMIN
MSTQAKTPKGKGKGARRVSNLSEEQRNKKRENDRIAQQNIRRRNKELIERLQREVELLRKLKHVDVTEALLKQNKMLQDEVRALRRAFYAQTGRMYPVPGADVDGVTPSEFSGDYVVQQGFSSPYITTSNLYGQWPSSVVPVASTATVHSVASSPGASAQGDDFTPGYAHSSLPPMEEAVMAGATTSAPALGSVKADYRGLEGKDFTSRGLGYLSADNPVSSSGGSSTNSYPGSNAQQHTPPYLHEPPWPPYQSSSYYPQPTAI